MCVRESADSAGRAWPIFKLTRSGAFLPSQLATVCVFVFVFVCVCVCVCVCCGVVFAWDIRISFKSLTSKLPDSSQLFQSRFFSFLPPRKHENVGSWVILLCQCGCLDEVNEEAAVFDVRYLPSYSVFIELGLYFKLTNNSQFYFSDLMHESFFSLRNNVQKCLSPHEIDIITCNFSVLKTVYKYYHIIIINNTSSGISMYT